MVGVSGKRKADTHLTPFHGVAQQTRGIREVAGWTRRSHPYLEYLAAGIVMVEGYAQQGPRDEQYLRSRVRASMVRDYLVGTFHLDPRATGAMPLSADSTGSPGQAPWDGVALAVILPKGALTPLGSR